LATQRVQLVQVLLAEMVVRAGDIIAQHDSGRLKETYKVIDPRYLDAIGISTIFHPGASLDQLVQAGGPFPHSKISFAIVDTLITELDRVRYEPILYNDSP
jgi:hypothetical protein